MDLDNCKKHFERALNITCEEREKSLHEEGYRRFEVSSLMTGFREGYQVGYTLSSIQTYFTEETLRYTGISREIYEKAKKRLFLGKYNDDRKMQHIEAYAAGMALDRAVCALHNAGMEKQKALEYAMDVFGDLERTDVEMQFGLLWEREEIKRQENGV